MNHQNQIVCPSLKPGKSGITVVIVLALLKCNFMAEMEVCFFFGTLFRRELRKKGKSKVPLKSRDWVLAKKHRLRRQGKYVQISMKNIIIIKSSS